MEMLIQEPEFVASPALLHRGQCNSIYELFIV